MQEFNPYAPPATPTSAFAPLKPDGNVGIWRQGKTLVMDRNALLPDVCIKSNQPTDGYRLKRKLSWHHPALSLLIIVSIPIYAIVAIIVSKRAVIHIGLSDAWRRRRLGRILLAWVGVLLAIAGIFAGAAIAETGRAEVGAPLLIGSVVMFFTALLYGMIGARLIRPKQIDDRFVYFNGAHPEFLNRFPEWAGPHQVLQAEALK